MDVNITSSDNERIPKKIIFFLNRRCTYNNREVKGWPSLKFEDHNKVDLFLKQNSRMRGYLNISIQLIIQLIISVP